MSTSELISEPVGGDLPEPQGPAAPTATPGDCDQGHTTNPGRIGVHGHWIDGTVRPAGGSEVIDGIDPATGDHHGAVAVATADEVHRAVLAARAAARAWRRTPAGERAAALRAAAAAVRAEADRLADLHCRTTGRLRTDAAGAVEAAAGLLDEAAGHGPLDAGRSLAGAAEAVDVVRREPRGVVAVITPWNDPYPAAAGILAAALVTGNTVVHKPSERSALAGWAFAELVARHLPPGVLNVVNGGAETGALLVADPDVDVVAHVGSSAAGARIAGSAGPRAARLLLENGGKDALIVDAGVDPAWAAAQAATGAFANAGQLCVSVERIVVHADVAPAFLAELTAVARSLRCGDPADPATRLGPLVDERAVAGVLAHVEDAVTRGARVHTGGCRADRPGCFVEATVLSGCTDEMAIWTEETFGPVAAVRVVGSFDEALRVAGEGSYGLAATVLTGSMRNALRAADELDVGTVKVNNVFGGAPGGSADPRRRSGSGRGYGPDLIGELTALKTVHLEPLPEGA